MTLIARQYNSIGSFIDYGFVETKLGNSSYNMFVKANFKSAFDDTGDLPVISYPLLLISKGSLPLMKVIESVVGDEGISLKYDTNLSLPKVSATDEVIALVKNKEDDFFFDTGLRGNGETGTLLIPYANKDVNDIVCCYIFARSADGKKTSNSVFISLEK